MAAAALERLCRTGMDDVPSLLEGLKDARYTSFKGLKRAGEGFAPLPSTTRSEIRVRQVAALLLERLIGKPGPRPATPEQWQTYWEKVRKKG